MNQVTAVVLSVLPKRPVMKFVFYEPVEKEVEIELATSKFGLNEVDRKKLQQAIKSEFGKTLSTLQLFFRGKELFIVAWKASKKYYIEFDQNLDPELIED
jgi:hypothetical protein